MVYDLAIIGGGPAGVSAGVYAARKRLKTIFLAESVGVKVPTQSRYKTG